MLKRIKYNVFVLIFVAAYVALSVVFFGNLDYTPATYSDYKTLIYDAEKYSPIENSSLTYVTFENSECEIRVKYDQNGNIVDIVQKDHAYDPFNLILLIFLIGSIGAAACCYLVHLVIKIITNVIC